MNNTDEYLEFGGVSLHRFGWSVTTVGSRIGIPPIRGDNQKAAGVPGELWMPKQPDARTIVLQMWVTGVDPDGDAVPDPRLRFNDNWAYLRQVFYNPDAESILRRRWWRTDPGTGQPGIAVAEALAQLAPGQEITPTMTTRTRATFEVPLRLAHPFFYGPTISTDLTPGTVTTITNPGDAAAWSKNFYVDLVGPLAGGCWLTNLSTGTRVGLTRPVAAGETVTLDVRQFLALSAKTGSAIKVNRTGEILTIGPRAWLGLLRGPNTLQFLATGAGKAVLRFRAPYL